MLYVPAYRIEWVPSIPPWPPHFWWTSRGLSAETVPRLAFRKAGSSSRELSCSFRDDSIVTCRPRRVYRDTRPAPTLGSLPYSRHQRPESTSDRVPKPDLRSVLDVSHVLDGLLLRPPCGLVSSRYHVQGFASGVSSHRSGAPTRRRRILPRRWHRAPTSLRWRQLPARRPRRFVLTDDPQWPARCLVPRGIRVPSCVLVLLRASLSRIFRCTGSALDLRRHRTASLRCRWSSAFRSIPDVQTSVPRDPFPFQLRDLRTRLAPDPRGRQIGRAHV